MRKYWIAVWIILGISSSVLPGADFWQTKKFSRWSDKEVNKMLRESPWARIVGVRFEERRGRPSSAGVESSAKSSGGGSSRRGSSRGGSSSGGSGSTEPVPATDVIFRWHTALPIKQAVARARYGDEVASSAEAAKILNRHETQYIVGVIGIPARAVTAGPGQLKEGAQIAIENHPPIQAAKVIPDQDAGVVDLYLYFPKELTGGHVITPDDGEVEVVVKLDSRTLKRKFKLKDMLYDGKLEM